MEHAPGWAFVLDALLAGQALFRVIVSLMLLVLEILCLGLVDLGDKFTCAHLGQIHVTPPITCGIVPH